MHVLFVHQSFPAQFGHIASYLSKTAGFRCTFVTQQPAGVCEGVEVVPYQTRGGATAQTHYCSCSFEDAIWHGHAVYETLRARPDIKPDLIVGHSGYLSTVFLRDLYQCPIINYFEYFYRPTDSDMDFRPDLPYPEINKSRARLSFTAMISASRIARWIAIEIENGPPANRAALRIAAGIDAPTGVPRTRVQANARTTIDPDTPRQTIKIAIIASSLAPTRHQRRRHLK